MLCACVAAVMAWGGGKEGVPEEVTLLNGKQKEALSRCLWEAQEGSRLVCSSNYSKARALWSSEPERQGPADEMSRRDRQPWPPLQGS